MSAPRRPGYREPTRAEAAYFAKVNKQWLKMHRRQARRQAARWAAAIGLIAFVGLTGVAAVYILVVGGIMLFDGITNL